MKDTLTSSCKGIYRRRFFIAFTLDDQYQNIGLSGEFGWKTRRLFGDFGKKIDVREKSIFEAVHSSKEITFKQISRIFWKARNSLKIFTKRNCTGRNHWECLKSLIQSELPACFSLWSCLSKALWAPVWERWF